MKCMILMFAVLALAVSVAAEVRADEYSWTDLRPRDSFTSYSQLLAEGKIRSISASEGGGPAEITLHYGVINDRFSPSFAIEVAGDTLVVSDHGAPDIYHLVRYFSEKRRERVMIGYEPRLKSIGFRTTIEGTIVKVETERNLLFLTRDYNLVKIISADQMFNDRSVAYRSFFGNHEGLHARLDVIYFPLSNEAILLAPAEYLPEKSAAGTVVRGQ